MTTRVVTLSVKVSVRHPDGYKLTRREIEMRVNRLLEEDAAGPQPDDFYLTDAETKVGAIWSEPKP